MIRIAISIEAFEAIARTMPVGSFGFERDPNAKGERTVWLEDAMVDRLGAMRGPGESYMKTAVTKRRRREVNAMLRAAREAIRDAR